MIELKVNQTDNKKVKEERTKRIFLIDLENVQDTGFNGVETLSKDDEVVIFLSKQAHKVSLLHIAKMHEIGVKIIYKEVFLDLKDSLDKQLIVYLGMKIGTTKKNEEYVIIGDDKGYNCVIQFLKQEGIKAYTSKSLALDYIVAVNSENNIVYSIHGNKLTEIETKIIKLEKEKYLSRNRRTEIIRAIIDTKSEGALHNSINAIVKDTNKTKIIYAELKTLMYNN